MDGFVNRSDTKSKLDGTVVLYKGEPVICRVRSYNRDEQEITDINEVTIERINKKSSFRNAITVSVTDPDFRCHPFNLGYSNVSNNAFFLQRLPHRSYKVGLCLNVLQVRNNGQEVARFNYPSIVWQPLANKYPSFEEAFNEVKATNNEVHGMAFHRHFCFRLIGVDQIGLFYKERLIGTRSRVKEDPKFSMLPSPDLSYFVNILTERGIEC